DVVVANADEAANSVSVLFGNGEGTLSAHTDFGTGVEPRSVVISDLDGDHLPDLATATYVSQGVSILLGSGSGTFMFRHQSDLGVYPQSLAIGDLDSDGQRDLVVAGGEDDVEAPGRVTLSLGNGDVSFGSTRGVAVESLASGVAIGDLNGDGISDLAVTAAYS